jgi:hypothetical protein
MHKINAKTAKGLKLNLFISENSKDLIRLCTMAIEAHLFVDGWCLRDELQRIINKHKQIEREKDSWIHPVMHTRCMTLHRTQEKVVLALDKKTRQPVAVTIKIDTGSNGVKTSDGFLQFFVKKNYRRFGVGGLLYQKMNAPDAKCEMGIDGSDKFFKKINIAYYNNDRFHPKVVVQKEPRQVFKFLNIIRQIFNRFARNHTAIS